MSTKFPAEEYNIREAKGEDYYRIMIVNTALINYKYKSDFPWCLIIEVAIKDKTERFKLPTEAEAIILNLLEDSFKEIIKGNALCQYIGRTTDNGHRTIYYYINNPQTVHEALQKFIQSGLNSYEFSYEMKYDTNWEMTKFFFDGI